MITKTALHDFAGTFGKKFHERHLYVGASEIGQCIRKVFYAKHQGDHITGVLPDSDHVDSWGAAHRGSVYEDAFWCPAMKQQYGDDILYIGKQQKRWQVGNLSGAPDGVLINQPRDALANLFVPDIGPSGEIVLDAKSIDPRAKAHLTKAKPEHVFQIITNMGLMREVGPHKPDWGVISYTNASFYDDITEFPVEFNQKVYENAKRRANQILNAADAGECRPEGWIGGGKDCEVCPWERACRALRGHVPETEKKPIDKQLLAELSDMAKEQRTAAEEVKAWTAKRRELEENIKERLREKHLRMVETDDMKIIWSSVKGRTTLDMDQVREACAEAGIDLDEFETQGDPTDRLLITVK